MKATIILLTLVLASGSARLEAQSFFQDNFNRPDSATVGNGWLDSPNNVGGNLSIRSGQLTPAGIGGFEGIYRPFTFATPVSVTATLAESSGFGGLPRQYSAEFAILSDGTLGTGYRLGFSRSDINFNDSLIQLLDGAALIARFRPSIQFGALLDLHFTFGVDGSVVGTVGQNGQSESFSFPAHAIQSTGANFLIALAGPDGRATSNPIFHRLDNLTISATPSGFLSLPLDVTCEGSPCTPFTAKVSAVLDHHVPTGSGYNCNHRHKNNCAGPHGEFIVLAFNGEEGNRQFGENCFPQGYKKNENGDPFLVDAIHYVGAGCNPKNKKERELEENKNPKHFLNYDGHSGYDFAYGIGTPILAAADGILEVPKTDLINGDPEKNNALRIIHPNGFETWYLHAREGSECLAFIGQQCEKNRRSRPREKNRRPRPQPGDSVEVKAGQQIAVVGDTGVKGHPHLHFEVRLGSDQVVDPYGCAAAVQAVDPSACVGKLWKD